MDFKHIGSSLAVRSFLRLGAALAIFGISRIGSSLSVFDFTHVGATLAIVARRIRAVVFSAMGSRTAHAGVTQALAAHRQQLPLQPLQLQQQPLHVKMTMK
jgi:hypothetical protein